MLLAPAGSIRNRRARVLERRLPVGYDALGEARSCSRAAGIAEKGSPCPGTLREIPEGPMSGFRYCPRCRKTMEVRICESCDTSTRAPGACHICKRPHELKTVDRVLLSGLAFCSNPACRVSIRLEPLPPKFSLDF